jgi:hypothetical protein
MELDRLLSAVVKVGKAPCVVPITFVIHEIRNILVALAIIDHDEALFQRLAKEFRVI